MAHGDETARYPYRVVIADDERGIREGLEDFIRNECPSFQVTGVFADGRQALDHLEAQGADILVSDISMPHMSGLDVVEQIKRAHPQLCVILITGYREFQYAKRALDLGVLHLVVKPVDFEELFRALQDAAAELERQKETALQEAERLLQDRDHMRTYLRLVTAGLLNAEILGRMGTAFPQGASCARVCFRCVDEQALGAFGGSVWQDMCEIQDDQVDAYCLSEDETSAEFFVLFPAGHPEYAEQFQQEAVRNLQRAYRVTIEASCRTYARLADIGEQRMEDVADALISSILDGRIADRDALTDVIVKTFHPDMFRQLLGALTKKLREQYELDTYDLAAAWENGRLDGDKAAQVLGQAEELLLNHFLVSGSRIKKIREYIAEHCDSQLSLNSVAEAFSLNPNYLSQLFRRETGERFGYYVSKVRIEKAKQLLRDTDWDVRRVAEAVGYGGDEYFSRVFKDHTGMAPRQYAHLVATGSEAGK